MTGLKAGVFCSNPNAEVEPATPATSVVEKPQQQQRDNSDSDVDFSDDDNESTGSDSDFS